MQIMVPGFLALILVGACILMLPVCNADGQWLNFTDALFTSCTSVCVTGLVTVVPAVQFTFFGKLVILFLIQVGGWGVIICAMYVLVLLKVRLSISERVLLQSYFSKDNMRGLVRMLLYVIRGSLVVEGIGAVGYALTFVPEFGFLRGCWYSIFHAVSAFCNAGVDLLGENSLAAYVDHPWMNAVTIFLIVSGGLGFVVWQEISSFVRKLVRREQKPARALRQMQLQAKLVIVMTAGLLIGGMLFFWMAEHNNPRTLGALPLGKQWMAAFFQSVTTRTAGFFMIPQDQLTEVSQLFACILMYIGGSPAGTAGGVKTVTVAVVLLTCWSILKGHNDTECFGRRIAPMVVRTSILICMTSIFLVFSGMLALSLLEPQFSMLEIAYEVVSATATVGLTAGVTPGLHTPGKYLIMVLMYCGRIGPVTLPLLIGAKLGRKNEKRSLPEEHIVVG